MAKVIKIYKMHKVTKILKLGEQAIKICIILSYLPLLPILPTFIFSPIYSQFFQIISFPSLLCQKYFKDSVWIILIISPIQNLSSIANSKFAYPSCSEQILISIRLITVFTLLILYYE